MDALHGKAEVLLRPAPARGVDAGRAAKRSTLPALKSSATAGSPEALAAASALSVAFSTKLWPVSSGSGKTKLARRHRVDADRGEQLGELLGLALVVSGDDDLIAGFELADHLRRR